MILLVFAELLAAVLVHVPRSIVKFAVNLSVRFENPPNSKAIFFAVVTEEIFLFPACNLVSSVAVRVIPAVFEELISKNVSLFKALKLLCVELA